MQSAPNMKKKAKILEPQLTYVLYGHLQFNVIEIILGNKSLHRTQWLRINLQCILCIALIVAGISEPAVGTKEIITLILDTNTALVSQYSTLRLLDENKIQPSCFLLVLFTFYFWKMNWWALILWPVSVTVNVLLSPPLICKNHAFKATGKIKVTFLHKT